ncbi:hypothetical protein, partial [Mycobacteroides abscessus]|uniref:hypothetical protein n=1 Tax=Mycobacteroides abscessus TaxID=36809 RepID=UPI001A95BD88
MTAVTKRFGRRAQLHVDGGVIPQHPTRVNRLAEFPSQHQRAERCSGLSHAGVQARRNASTLAVGISQARRWSAA